MKTGPRIQHALTGLASAAGLALLLAGCTSPKETASLKSSASALTQFIYTSDAHYGIARDAFQGGTNVDAKRVNAALVAKANALPSAVFPQDGGLRAGQPVGAFDFVVETGDLANRAEGTKPRAGIPAGALWTQFQTDYLETLSLKTAGGAKAPVYLVPGNHDVSNALGFYKPSTPFPIDPAAYLEIYNRMLQPATPLTAAAWGSTQAAAKASYTANKVFYSKDINGAHLLFINMWPDSAARTWMEQDLAKVSPTTPVAIFTHDQPEIETKHLTNPNGTGDINAKDGFENLVADSCTDPDASGKLTVKSPTVTQQRALAAFLKAHKNIVAYFHGNDNAHEAYVWKGPDGDLALNVFRVDSPMKGNLSSNNEAKVSFQVVTMDTKIKTMTVREYLWNSPTPWGTSTTVSLMPRTH